MRILIALITLFFLLPLATANEFTLGTASLDLNACTYSTDQVLITNVGLQTASYSLALFGSAADYALPQQAVFTLAPDEHYLFNISYGFADAATYNLRVVVASSLGEQQEFTKTINAAQCSNNMLFAHNFNQSSCPCLPITYDLGLTNAGPYPETYVIGLDQFSSVANVSHNPIQLLPAQTQNFTLTVQPTCDIYGEQIVNLYSTAQASGIKTKIPLVAQIDKCYDYEIQTATPILNDADKEEIDFIASDSTYEVCSGGNETIPLLLKNTGYIPNNFTYELTGPEWAQLSDTKHFTDAGAQTQSFIDVAPAQGTFGKHTVVLTAESLFGLERVQEVVELNVVDCHELRIDIASEQTLCNCDQEFIDVEVTNLGKYPEPLQLSVEGADYLAFSPSTLTIDPNESITTKLVSSPACDYHASDSIIVSATLANGLAHATDESKLTVQPLASCYSLNIEPQESLFVTYDPYSTPILIEHQGIKAANYTVEVIGEDWMSVDEDSVYLEAGARHTILFTTAPNEAPPGTYTALIEIKTDDIIFQKEIDVTLRSQHTKIGTTLYRFRYSLITFIVGIAVLIGIALYARHTLLIWNTKRIIHRTQKKKQETHLPWAFFIFAAILLLLFFVPLPAFEVVFGLLALYQWYIISGLIILAIIITIIKRFEK